MHYLIASLRRTVAFAEAVAAGELDRTQDITSGDGVGMLAAALRNMVGNLREMITASKRSEQDALDRGRPRGGSRARFRRGGG